MSRPPDPSPAVASPGVGGPLGNAEWSALAARLRRYAMALTRDMHEAEDLSQQTLASMLARGTTPDDPEAYAITSATRLWISRQRSIRRSVARLARFAVGQPRAARPDTGPDRREQREAIDRAVHALPPVQRAVFVLRVVEQLDYAGIAAALECDVGAVRASLHLARARLRTALADIGEARVHPGPEQDDPHTHQAHAAGQKKGG
jgi:RNA polymerase sigma-70 factor (ECF subfamily)